MTVGFGMSFFPRTCLLRNFPQLREIPVFLRFLVLTGLAHFKVSDILILIHFNLHLLEPPVVNSTLFNSLAGGLIEVDHFSISFDAFDHFYIIKHKQVAARRWIRIYFYAFTYFYCRLKKLTF